MAVTAKDIAGKLGLSQPTVSRVLSGARGHRVSPDTRQRVLEAARQMGYRPNAVARSLRRRRTNIVGFYTGYGYVDARDDFLAEIIGGLQFACTQHHLDLLLHGIYHGRATEDIYGVLADGRIDGLFLHTSAADSLAERLVDSSLHVVALADPVPGLPSVVCDDAGGTRQILEYLWARGHRQIAYIASEVRLASVERRVAAFVAWMAERGRAGEDAPLLRAHFDEVAPALDTLRSLPARPTAVCCWHDRAAYALLRCCRERAIRVPEDLAVVGFDGFLDTKLPARDLMTAAAPWAEAARIATDILVAHIENRDVPRETCLPVRLIAGDTA